MSLQRKGDYLPRALQDKPTVGSHFYENHGKFVFSQTSVFQVETI
jgi:hypothetical protein